MSATELAVIVCRDSQGLGGDGGGDVFASKGIVACQSRSIGQGIAGGDDFACPCIPVGKVSTAANAKGFRTYQTV